MTDELLIKRGAYIYFGIKGFNEVRASKLNQHRKEFTSEDYQL
jgi:hypothetical protein